MNKSDQTKSQTSLISSLIRFDPAPPVLGPILSPHFLVFPVSLFFMLLCLD